MRPENLLLRCYAASSSKGWYAHCIDLNIDAEGKTFEAVKISLENAILGYLETVLETNDNESLTYLIYRPSSLKHRMYYRFIKLVHLAHLAKNTIIFKDAIPFRLAPDCA